MSGLTFLIGRANAGQTDALYRTAAAHAKRGERALVIVPEQATFAAERRLADIAGAGLIGVQVLSVALPWRCAVLRRFTAGRSPHFRVP